METISKYINNHFNSLANDYINIYHSINENPTENAFIIIAAILLPIFYLIRKTKLGKSSFMFVLAFPGTVVHELLHFTMAILMGGNPQSFSIIPKKVENGYVLGSVELGNINHYNAMPIAMAPLLAPIAILLTLPFCIEHIGLSEHSIALGALYSFIIVSVIDECIPSSADVEVMLKKKLGLLVYIFIFGYIIHRSFFR